MDSAAESIGERLTSLERRIATFDGLEARLEVLEQQIEVLWSRPRGVRLSVAALLLGMTRADLETAVTDREIRSAVAKGRDVIPVAEVVRLTSFSRRPTSQAAGPKPPRSLK